MEARITLKTLKKVYQTVIPTLFNVNNDYGQSDLLPKELKIVEAKSKTKSK